LVDCYFYWGAVVIVIVIVIYMFPPRPLPRWDGCFDVGHATPPTPPLPKPLEREEEISILRHLLEGDFAEWDRHQRPAAILEYAAAPPPHSCEGANDNAKAGRK